MFGWWNICWNLESKLLICCVNLFCFEVLSLESNIWNKKRNRFLALDECFSPQAFLQLRLSKWHFGCGSIDLWAGSELGYGPALMWLWNWIWGPLQKMRNKPVGLWPTATKILGGKPDSKATGFWKAASSLHVHSIYIFGSFEPFEFLSQIYSRWIGELAKLCFPIPGAIHTSLLRKSWSWCQRQNTMLKVAHHLWRPMVLGSCTWKFCGKLFDIAYQTCSFDEWICIYPNHLPNTIPKNSCPPRPYRKKTLDATPYINM